jgi:glucuronate isomerase
MFFFGRLDAEKGWTKQLHLGAMRSVNTRMTKGLGPDTGFDSIGDWPQANSLGRYLDRLDSAGLLPKTIVYNAHPENNYVFATMIGNFRDGKLRVSCSLAALGNFLIKGKGGMAAACASKLRAALALHRNGDRLAVLDVQSSPRIFPPNFGQPAPRRNGEWAAAERRRTHRDQDQKHFLR